MALAETANLIVNLGLKGNFARDMGKAQKTLDSFTRSEGRAFRAGAQIGTGIKNAGRLAAVGVGILASQVALGLDSLIKLEKATAQTEAVIKSTGGAAGQTAASIAKLSEKYESMNALVGDEFIQAGSNMLLTFTNIRKKGFEPALQAVLDMNTAMGNGPEGLTKTAIQVGKALNDPTTGLTALRKVGVAFTKEQTAKIKSLQKEGKLYEAQQIILKELNKEFGGSFAKQGGTTAAKVALFKDAVDDLQRSLATALLPAVSNVAGALSSFLQEDDVIKGAEDLGKALGGLFSKENIRGGINALRGAFNTFREVAPILASAARATAGFISTAVSAFKTLPPEIQGLLVGGFALNKLTGGLVTNIGGGLISAVLRQLKSAVVTVHGGVVNVSGPGVGGPTAGGSKGGMLTGLLGLAGITIAIEEAVRAGIEYGAKNTELGDKGLNSAEIAAVKYYQSSIAEQQIAAKRLGYIPTKADFDAAMAKLGKTITNPPGKGKPLPPGGMIGDQGPRTDPAKIEWRNQKRDKAATAIEKMHASIGPSLSQTPVKLDLVKTGVIEAALAAKNAGIETKDATIEAGVKSKNSTMEVKAQVASGTMIQQALAGAQLATTMTTAFGTQGAVRGVAPPIVGAIRANRPHVTTIVNVTATHVTKSTTVQARYGPGGGSGSQDARPGDSGV